MLLVGPGRSWLILIDSGWSWLVLVGTAWSWSVLVGSGWSLLVLIDPGWSWLLLVGPCWSWLVLSGPDWSMLVLTGPGWSWLVLVLVGPGLSLFSVCSTVFMNTLSGRQYTVELFRTASFSGRANGWVQNLLNIYTAFRHSLFLKEILLLFILYFAQTNLFRNKKSVY